jgi:hypothetical protein
MESMNNPIRVHGSGLFWKARDREDLAMTYKQVAELFGTFRKASTWPTKNPRLFHFHRDGGEEYTVDLYEDDGKARYLRVPLGEVREYVEPTGETDSKNVYFRLKGRGRK